MLYSDFANIPAGEIFKKPRWNEPNTEQSFASSCYSFSFAGVFGSRGRGMTGPGRGPQQMQDKKSGKQGMKNQHWKAT